MKLKKFSILVVLAVELVGCGKTVGSSSSGSGVTVQANTATAPVASFNLMKWFGITSAWASVSSYNSLRACVSEVVYETLSGSAGSSTTPLKPGLLTFSPSSTVSVGTMQITSGTVLKNIKFTIATVPSLCQSADYSVSFTPVTTEQKITQDVSFKFDFGVSGYTISGGETISLYLEKVINSMVALGAISNSNIQTIDAGQAL